MTYNQKKENQLQLFFKNPESKSQFLYADPITDS